jgi:glucose-6-phosphate isomerase
LGRGDRGGKPRLYFLDHGFDNDATQGLLDLVGHGRRTATIDERWGLIAIDSFNPEPTATAVSENSKSHETAVALRTFLGALRDACGGDATALANLVVTVVARGEPLGDIAKSLGCPEVPPFSSGAEQGPATFTSATILLAAVLGLDVMRLLEGADAMTQRFHTAAPGDNPALDFAAVCHRLGASQYMLDRELLTWADGLTSVGAWFNALFRETPNKQGRGAARRLAVNLIVDQPRRDRLVDSQLGQPLSSLLAAAIERTKQCQTLAGMASVDIHLPIQDESCFGQLFQMMLLAAAAENRLRR